MGRVTFQDPAVIRRINKSFCATWTNVQPAYQVAHLEGAQFEKAKGIPNGQASENVVTLISTPGGELLHVVPGHWKPKDYLTEIDFARGVARAAARAGADPAARRQAVIEKHRERLAVIDGQWEGGPLGRMVMENVHQRMIQEPLRPVSEVRGVEDYALNRVISTLAQKVHQLQQAIPERQREGEDVRPVVAVMQGFDGLLPEGKLIEAEARVDKALSLLGERFAPGDRGATPPPAAPPAELAEAIHRKMQRASELAEQWKREGRDLTPVARILNAVEPLLREGRFREAETVLDRGLSLLSAARTPGPAKPATRAGGPPPAFPPMTKTDSPEALAAEIEALRPAKPGWRAIAWKTCLLDALNTARQGHKPVLLWVLGGEPLQGRC
jgi:hypothetical protein